MKLALATHCWKDENLLFAQQFGVNTLLAQPVLPRGGAGVWDASTLAALRNRVERAGLALAGLESLPCPLDRAVRGEDGCDDDIAAAARFVEAAGEAGIPLIAYAWAPASPAPARAPAGRGRAAVQRWPSPVDAGTPGEAAWQHFTRFLERVIPVAEQAGVKLACRAGALLAQASPGLLDTPAAWARCLALTSSPAHGLDLHPAALADPAGSLQQLAHSRRIYLAQVQHLRADGAGIAEGFLDEAGVSPAGMLAVLKACRAAGIPVVRPAPPPGIVGDTDWGHTGQAFHIGYLRALFQVIERAG